MKKTTILATIFFSLLLSCTKKPQTQQSKPISPDQKEVLLVGTFHYNNPRADIAKFKSFDILSEKAQLELKEMTAKIKQYNPTKIFVEWPYQE